jgi:diadenosine tetraphosphatase ApaH/serine/threonine PP2A family protein phosphatase
MKNAKEINRVFQDHIDAMSADLNLYGSDLTYNPPFLEKKLLIQVIEHAILHLSKDETIINIQPPCVVVGDIHGHILDLYNIIVSYGLPPSQKYLFLGDIVDRGNHSLECITFIYLLKIFYPDYVFIIRGNHEVPYCPNEKPKYQSQQTLLNEIIQCYGNPEIFSTFSSSFNYIPIAAKIGTILCVHGGINKKSLDLNDLARIKKPIYEINEDVTGYLWSDPKEGQAVEFAYSLRGNGYTFNEQAFNKFMEINKLTLMVRGHQFTNGPKFTFGDRLLTIFSASNYLPNQTNVATCLYIDKSFNKIIRVFEPLVMPTRNFNPARPVLDPFQNLRLKSQMVLSSSCCNFSTIEEPLLSIQRQPFQKDADQSPKQYKANMRVSMRNPSKRSRLSRIRCSQISFSSLQLPFKDQIFRSPTCSNLPKLEPSSPLCKKVAKKK